MLRVWREVGGGQFRVWGTLFGSDCRFCRTGDSCGPGVVSLDWGRDAGVVFLGWGDLAGAEFFEGCGGLRFPGDFAELFLVAVGALALDGFAVALLFVG